MSTNEPVQRRRGEAARNEAVAVARDLLLAAGPQAVTLKAVGERMGVGHANLIHHFGSAEGLRGALMDRMVRDMADRITTGLQAPGPPGQDERRRMMDVVFDAFGEGGAAHLAAWMALAREAERAQSFAEVVRGLVDRLAALGGGGPEAQERAQALVITAVYMAFADGLIGETLTGILDAPRDGARDLALGIQASQ